MNNLKTRWIALIGIVFIAMMVSVVAQRVDYNYGNSRVEPSLSADEYHGKALLLMAQADAKYNPDFFDQTGWLSAVGYAEAAVNAQPSNPEYLRTLGEAYTKTQFWIEGYRAFKQLQTMGSLDSQAREWAALCAAKLGYIRLSNNDPEEAVGFLQEALNWQERTSVRALLHIAQTTHHVFVADR